MVLLRSFSHKLIIQYNKRMLIKSKYIQKPVRFSYRFLLLGVMLSLGLMAFKKHAFHTSITEMRYNAKEKSFEISLRVFKDDLETVLTKENQGKKIVLDKTEKFDPQIDKYIQKHFVWFNARNQRVPYHYLGKEQEGDAMWLYIEMPAQDPISGSKLQK
jgi:hypothetical protein